MNLLQIRSQFIKMSGRFDLVTFADVDGPFTDAGSDYFIEAGLRWLDDHSDHQQTSAVFTDTLAAGDYLLQVTNVRSIDSVWTEDSEGVVHVNKVPSLEVLEEYGKPPFADVSRTRPKWYATTPYRLLDAAVGNISRLERHIYLVPPADKEYTVNVEGDFYSGALEEDTDVNWWSLKYPHTLVQAALYMMERHYRNFEGARDHMNAILSDIQGVDFNLAAEDAAGIDQMDNSW